jgi:hypothetical protein
VDIARVASEVGAIGQLRAALSALKSWTASAVDSLIIGGLPLLFDEFSAKWLALL